MRELLQSTAENVMVFMVLSSDSKTGATGKTLTITLSKNGGSFNSISPTVTDRGNGWYNLALTTSHTDTLGDIALHIEAADCDPSDLKHFVVPATSGLRDVHAKTIEDGAITTVKIDSDVFLEIADAILKRDFSAITGESSRSLLNAARFLRNKWSVSSGTLTVTKENDSTTAWTAAVTGTAGADPVTGVDPS